MCDTAARAHLLGGRFRKNCHILVLFTRNLPLTGGKLQHSWSNCLDLTDLFSRPRPPAQEKQIKKRRQMVTSLCCARPKTTLPPPPPQPHRISSKQVSLLPTSSIPVCPLRVCLNVCFRSFSTKANGLLPAIDTAV